MPSGGAKNRKAAWITLGSREAPQDIAHPGSAPFTSRECHSVDETA
jgi:hypothetical protein